MKDMLQPKKSFDPMVSLPPVFENGLVRIKSESSLLLVDTENTMPMISRSYSEPNLLLSPLKFSYDPLELVSSTPESRVKNKNQLETCNDKLTLCLKGIPITRLSQMSGLVSIIRGRDLSPYWTESKGDLFQRLLLPKETDFVDSHLSWSNGSAPLKTHPSWFLVRTTKNLSTQPLNSLKTSLPSPLSLSVDTMEEDDTIKNFLLKKTEGETKRTNKSIAKTIGRRLTGKVDKKTQESMTSEQLDAYKESLQAQKQDMLPLVTEEKKLVQRQRLYRIYGTKKQYEFLRQQRGICRHLYNLCLSDIREHYQSNKHIIQFLHFLLETDEVELTEQDIKSIQGNIYEYMFLSESFLRAKYQPDSYWRDNQKSWGLSIPSNLRTSMIKNVISNILVACKTSKGGFSMTYLSKKRDKFMFSLSVSTQQINIKTGTVVPSTRKHKERTTRTKDIVFQYMSTKCPGQGKFTVRVREKDKFPISKKDVHHDCQFIYKSGCWYIGITHDIPIQPRVDTKELKICSIDVGIKTPFTVYDPQDGSITEIGTSKDSLERIKNPLKTLSTHARLERVRRMCRRIQSRLDIKKKESRTRGEKHKCVRIEHGLNRLRYKKKCLIDELHYKTIQYLTSNYDVILMPYFDTQRMIKQKKLSKKSKQAMSDLNFSLFRDRLVSKVESQGKIWLEVSEAYTTKSCVRCGHIQCMDLKQRIFDCPRCHLRLGRDVHSAISILVKNAELVLTPCF